MKVAMLDKKLLKQFASYCATLTTILSAIVIFVDIPNTWKIIAGIAFLVILTIIYLALWCKANKSHNVSLKIGSTTVELKSGDLFQEDGLKAIAFK